MKIIQRIPSENKQTLVHLSNDLCRKPCLFTLEEQKAAYVIFSQIKSFSKNDTKLKISKDLFFSHFGFGSADQFTRYAKIVVGLQKKSWFILDDPKTLTTGIAISTARWHKYEDFFEIHLNEEFMPHLEQLAMTQFSAHNIVYAVNMTSKYSLALYRFCSSWTGIKGEEKTSWFTDQSIKELFNVAEDSYFARGKFQRRDFEKKTLDIAVKEINCLTNLDLDYERASKQGQVFGYRVSYSKKDIALETNCAEVELLDEKPKSLNQTAPSTESPYVEDFCPEPTHIKEDHNLDLQYLLDDEYSEFNAAGINQLKDFKCLHLYDAEIKQYWASIQKVLFSKHACGDGSHCFNDGDHYVIKRSEDKKLVLQKYICQKDKAKRFT